MKFSLRKKKTTLSLKLKKIASGEKWGTLHWPVGWTELQNTNSKGQRATFETNLKCPTLPMPLATISKIWGQKSDEMGKLVWTPIGLTLTQKRLGTCEEPLGKLGESHVAEAFAGQIERSLGEEWGGKSRQIPQLLRNPLGGGWQCNLSSELGHFWGWSGQCKVIRTSINWANQDMWLPSPISFLGSREGNHQNYDQPQQIDHTQDMATL